MAAATCLAALLGVTWAAQANAAPKWMRLSIVNEPSETMTVTWHTAAQAQSRVEWGTDAAALGQSGTGMSFVGPGNLGHIHSAEMTSLQPDTRYYYRVGDATDGWSATLSFKTAPPARESCGKVRLIFLGDNRPDSTVGMGDAWTSIFAEAVTEDPHVVLNGGDLVQDGKNVGEWEDLLDYTGPPAQYVPMMPVMGNHDDDTVKGDEAKYNQIFTLPPSSGTGATGTEDHYYFTYGPIIVAALNTQQFGEGNPPFSNQAAWLDEVLTNNPRKWKFVMLHHPIYTGGSDLMGHPPNEVNQNAALVPVFDKHHVDFVLQSHVHWYERYEPSNCTSKGNPGSTKPCSVGANNFAEGTVYMTSGGAGVFTIPFCQLGGTSGRVCDSNHHYVIFDVDNEHLDMQTWATSRQTVGDSPSNRKLLDQVTIDKQAVDCTVVPDAGVPDAAGDAEPLADAQTGQDAPVEPDSATPKDSGGSGGSAGSSSDAAADSGQPEADGGVPATASEAAGSDGGCGCDQAGSRPAGRWSWFILVGFLAGGLLKGTRLRKGWRQVKPAAQ